MKKNPDEQRMEILNLVLTFEVTKGHLKWKVSDVSRKLKVSRSLIYYHFGKSKEHIIEGCYEMIAEEFYALKSDMMPLRTLDVTHWQEALLSTQKLYLQNSAIVVFFHRWRMVPSETQNRMIAIEKKFQAKLKKVFPELNLEQILAVHAMMHGIVTCPFANPAAISHVVTAIRNFLMDAGVKPPLTDQL